MGAAEQPEVVVRACGFDGIGVLVEGGDDEVGQRLVAARKYR